MTGSPLIDEWLTTLRRLRAHGDLAGAGARLLGRWSEPHRRYHDLDHLEAVLRHVDDLADHAADPDAVRLAAWYHDAVHQGRGGGADEEASARLADEELTALRLDPAVVAEVVRLVRLTATHDAAAGDSDGEVLCDADLAVLASRPDEYDAYAAAVRAEYSHVDAAAFRAGRAQVLRSLLAQPTLFRTPHGRRHWEAAARVNVDRELAVLDPPEAP